VESHDGRIPSEATWRRPGDRRSGPFTIVYKTRVFRISGSGDAQDVFRQDGEIRHLPGAMVPPPASANEARYASFV